MEREEPLPARIDRYEPLRRLAVGGMAEIFLAKQSGLEGFEKVVVLKRILSNLASDDEFVSMFLDEARIAAKLSHPNIVQIYDLGKADNTYYIAMEYVSGRNIQHLITKQMTVGGHLPIEHTCRIIAGVCDGLFYAHGRNYDGKPLNIIHRDISPQNILVSFAGGVKVVDFGIAKASTQLAQTRAGVLKGKYAYMSPEQVRGSKIDHRSDIFALGLVMYEMLTGVRAFERDSSIETLKAIVQAKPVNPREMNPDIPMDVVKILSKALEKNPERRYKTAQEFQLALEDWLEKSPKKSNNVRLSRFLYELFDDELNSADGTMVVKGVGQIVIPTSRGVVEQPVADDVDNETLTAALVEPEPVQPASTGTKPQADKTVAPKVAVPTSPQTKASTPKSSTPKPSTPKPSAPKSAAAGPDRPTVPAAAKGSARPAQPSAVRAAENPIFNDDEIGTIPSYDMERLERERAEREKRARAPSTGRPPLRVELVDNISQGDDEKTRMVPTASSEESANASIELVGPAALDLRARAMLEKVDAIAREPAAPAGVPAAGVPPAAVPLPSRPGKASGFEAPAMGGNPAFQAPVPHAAEAPTWDPPTGDVSPGNMTADDEAVPTGPALRLPRGPFDSSPSLPEPQGGPAWGVGSSPAASGGPLPAWGSAPPSAPPGWGAAGDGLDDAGALQGADAGVGHDFTDPAATVEPSGAGSVSDDEPAVPALLSAPTRPRAWTALVAASAMMGAMSLVLFTVGAVAFPSTPTVVEYGVVVLQGPASGATATVSGTTAPVPGQLVVPLATAEHIVEIATPGQPPRTEKVVFADGVSVVTLTVMDAAAGQHPGAPATTVP
jgi:serine/threonine protein kinase